jgi:hypothetical protein
MVIKDITTPDSVVERGAGSDPTTTLVREAPTKKRVWILGLAIGVGAALLIAIAVAVSRDPQPRAARGPSSTGRVVGEDPAYLGVLPGGAALSPSTGRVVGEDPAYLGVIREGAAPTAP